MSDVKILHRVMFASSVIVVAGCILTGCSQPTEAPGYGGEPTATGETLFVKGTTADRVRAWALDDTLIVTTMGSGSCPLVPEVHDIDDERQVIVLTTSVFDPTGSCTADLGPRTFDLDAEGRDLSGFTVEVTSA
jgi:hypothetical protein